MKIIVKEKISNGESFFNARVEGMTYDNGFSSYCAATAIGRLIFNEGEKLGIEVEYNRVF